MEIPLLEVEACSCLLSCDVNMTVPGQVSADRQSEVFCILDCLQLSVMDMVVLCKGSLLVRDPDNLTLVSIKLHQPFVLQVQFYVVYKKPLLSKMVSSGSGYFRFACASGMDNVQRNMGHFVPHSSLFVVARGATRYIRRIYSLAV